MTKKIGQLTLKKACNLMRLPGHKLMRLHTQKGLEFFVVPGGPVQPETARKIIERADVRELDRGLLPETPQSWVLR